MAGGANFGFYPGFQPTWLQWNEYFSAKADFVALATAFPYGVAGEVVTTTGVAGSGVAVAPGALTVTPTLGTTARSLSALFGDNYNLKSLGAALSGLSGDGSAIQAAYSSVPLNGTIDVPIGNWPSGFSITPNTAGAKFWNLLGTLDAGTAAAGTSPIQYIGDGDVAFGFSGGCLQYYQQFTANLNIRPTTLWNFSYNAASIGSGPVDLTVAPVMVNTVTGANAGLGVTAYYAQVQSYGQTGFGGNDIGFSTQVGVHGKNWAWGGVLLIADASGNPISSAGQIYGLEIDVYANGPDQTNSNYNTTLGQRHGLFIHGYPYTGYTARTNNTQVYSTTTTTGTTTTAQNVIAQSVAGTLSIFKCTTSGITAASPPTFTAGTVTDGTAIWTYQGPSASQVAHAFNILTDPNCQFGTGYSAQGSFYNAVLDFSQATLAAYSGSVPAGMRLAPNMGIDFSAAGTLASQNLRYLSYSSSLTQLYYNYNGNTLFAAKDSGQFQVGGTLLVGFGSYGANLAGISTGYPTAGATFGVNYSNGGVEFDIITGNSAGLSCYYAASGTVNATPFFTAAPAGTSYTGVAKVSNEAVTAAGTNGATATIAGSTNFIDVNAGTGGIRLPAVFGAIYTVANQSGSTITVYSSDGTTTAGTLTTGTSSRYYAASSNNVLPA